jgi:hypothetical protein
MSEDVIGGPPRSFYVISGIALAWNLVGVILYVMQVTMTDEVLAAMDPSERALIEATPSWLIAVYALAVNAGALGCLLLILRKAWSVPVLIVSLLCIVVQMGYSTFMTDAIEVYGGAIAAQSAFITAIGLFLVWYSRGAKAKGLIS